MKGVEIEKTLLEAKENGIELCVVQTNAELHGDVCSVKNILSANAGSFSSKKLLIMELPLEEIEIPVSNIISIKAVVPFE